MGLLDRKRSVVIVIDLQGKLMGMVHRPELVIAGTVRLLQLADLFGVPVVMTEQYPQGIGPTHETVQQAFDSLTAEKRVVTKDAFSCCGEAMFEHALADVLPNVEVADRQIVLAGVEAHICVVQTALGLLSAGSEVQLCWECVSGRGQEYRDWAIQRMQQAGVGVTNGESVGFEWAGDKNHESFKPMSQLFKAGQPS